MHMQTATLTLLTLHLACRPVIIPHQKLQVLIYIDVVSSRGQFHVNVFRVSNMCLRRCKSYIVMLQVSNFTNYNQNTFVIHLYRQ